VKSFPTIYWLYAAWKALSGVVIVVGGAMPTVLLGWDTMLPSGKMVAVAGLVVSGFKSIDMLFDHTMRRLADGKTPAASNGNGGDTQQVPKP